MRACDNICLKYYIFYITHVTEQIYVVFEVHPMCVFVLYLHYLSFRGLGCYIVVSW